MTNIILYTVCEAYITFCCYTALCMCLFVGAVYVKNRTFFSKKQPSCFEHSSLWHMAAQLRGYFVIWFLIVK